MVCGSHRALPRNDMNLFDISDTTARAAPAIGVTGLSLAGIALSQWVYIVTLGYLILQAGFLIWKWRNAYLDRRSKHHEQGK